MRCFLTFLEASSSVSTTRSLRMRIVPRHCALEVLERMQRQDLQVQRLAGAKETIELHVEIEGVEFARGEWLSVDVGGERNFFAGQDGARSAFDLSVTGPGFVQHPSKLAAI